jgi:geranylgeranyl reductase family protein
MKDVIVVGAGPAGATTAMVLAKQGYDVLLLDQADFPRDKCCGDGLLEEALQFVEDLGMADIIRQAGFYPIHGGSLITPKKVALNLDIPNSGFVTPRMQLDALFFNHACQSGAEFRLARVLKPISQNNQITGVQAVVNGELQEISARVVIAADGSNSIMARALHGKKPKKYSLAMAVRCYLEGVQILPNRIEFFLPAAKTVGFGYGWLFPLGDGKANVGVGLGLDIFQKKGISAKSMLTDFLNQEFLRQRINDHAVLKHIKTGILNFCTPERMSRVFNGALLVGDAGALVDPFDGGGLPNAMLSARLAAHVIDKALSAGNLSKDGLVLYDQLLQRLILKRSRKRYRLRQLLSMSPNLVEQLVKRALVNDRFLRRFIDSRFKVIPEFRMCLSIQDNKIHPHEQ